MKIYGFRNLKVWQNSRSLALQVYQLTNLFPKEELFGLSSQMRRAAVSVTSNIAEGYNRFYRKEYIRFLYYALGSCAELETQLEIAYGLNYLDNKDYDSILDCIDHESRMLTKLITKLK